MTTRVAFRLLAGLAFAVLSMSLAQQMQAVYWEAPAGTSEYTQDYRIEVGDIPGHIVRIAQLRWDLTMMEPVPTFNGVEAVSAVTAVITDYHDFNGGGPGYMIFTLETGDRIFTETVGSVHTTYQDDGSPNASSFLGVITIKGGTGDFTGIRGTLRQRSVWNLATDQSKAEPTVFEGEYWFVNDME